MQKDLNSLYLLLNYINKLHKHKLHTQKIFIPPILLQYPVITRELTKDC